MIGELHIYARHNMQLWVQWFTFFVGVNYVALGWFAGEIGKGIPKDLKPLRYVAALFIFQNILGVWVSLAMRAWFKQNTQELALQYSSLGVSASRFSNTFYGLAIALGSIAMTTIAVIWLVFALWP